MAKKKKKKSKEALPHIKAFCVLQELQIKLASTDIVILQCDRQKKNVSPESFKPKSVILCVRKNKSDKILVDSAIEKINTRGIDIFLMYNGDELINKYLNGDF